MTERAIPVPPHEAAERATAALAARLGLGDATQLTEDWPVEEGDAVLRANLVGDVSGTVVLAVNSDVATRLLAASDDLAAAMNEAANELSAAFGVGQLEADAAQLIDAERPELIVAIVDDDQLTALAGFNLTLPEALLAPDDARELTDDGGTPAQYEPAIFDQSDWNPSADSGGLSLLGGVEMLVTAELGRTKMPMRELLGLTPGMVVEIDRAAGSPIDLLVNGRRIATGEVVVIDEEFGIRITEIVSVVEQGS